MVVSVEQKSGFIFNFSKKSNFKKNKPLICKNKILKITNE